LFVVVVVVSATSPSAAAQRPEGHQEFAEAKLFLELNDTDGDLGIHALIDGGPWTDLAIEGPNDRALLHVLSRGRLRAHGLSELAFESAEPSFDDLSPEAFFRRFPQGRYEFEARSVDGVEIESTVFLSHVLAAPPENVTVSGFAAAESCELPDLPIVAGAVTIRWDPVTQSHPDIGRRGGVEISRYQLFVETEGVTLAVDLPPTVTEFEVPTGITERGDEFKFEIIAQTTAGNNTAIESCFVVQ
jgi:hypothetical protein